jgi:hypothetical protein
VFCARAGSRQSWDKKTVRKWILENATSKMRTFSSNVEYHLAEVVNHMLNRPNNSDGHDPRFPEWPDLRLRDRCDPSQLLETLILCSGPHPVCVIDV